MVLSFFAVICLSEGIHVMGMLLKWGFRIRALLTGIVFLCFAAAGIFLYIIWKKKRLPASGPVRKANNKNILYEHPVYMCLIMGLILLQIIWNYYMHEPYVGGDLTVENVRTILSSNTVYQINPMTGEAFREGMPVRLKILVLPVIYATICKWTGLPPQTVIYEWIPTLVLVLSYLVYCRYACFLFPDDREKQCEFMLFIVILYQFGANSVLADGFRAMRCGFTGESIRALVILPYVLLSCLRKKWWRAAMGAITEVCLVWTLYGMGYSMAIIAGILALDFSMIFYRKLRKGGMSV